MIRIKDNYVTALAVGKSASNSEIFSQQLEQSMYLSSWFSEIFFLHFEMIPFRYAAETEDLIVF